MLPMNEIAMSGGDTSWLVLLAEATLKGTLLLICAVALAFALRKAPASLRHMVWSVALVAMMAVPLLSLVLPRWSLPLVPRPAVVASSSTNKADARLPRPVADGLSSTTEVPAAGSSVLISSRPHTPSMPVAGSSNSVNLRSNAGVLVWIWLSGVMVCLVAIVVGVTGLHLLTRRAKRLEEPSWNRLLKSLKREIALERHVVLLRSETASMPATWGVTHPVVLLPREATGWTEERRRVVLLHELAHVKRYDCFTQRLAQICCALYWFHPGVWYIAQRMRAERELACDEQVLRLGVNACDYADHLLDIAYTFRSPVGAPMSAVAMARPSQLEGRLLAILDGDTSQAGVPVISRLRVFVALLLVTLPLAAMRPWRDTASVTPSSGSDETPQPQEMASAPPVSIVAVSDTFRWKARAFQGKWIEIHANVGDIRAVLADGSEVEVIAVRKTPGRARETLRMNVDRRRRGFDVCVLPSTAQRRSCEDAFMKNDPGSGIRVDYLVRVPAGVGFGGHTVTGNVYAEGLQSYVWGTAVRGNILLSTSDLAEASTNVGSISASFGRANWRQDLEFETGNGDVTVIAPSNSRTMVQAETNRGRVTSDFPLSAQNMSGGDHRVGRIGTGGGMLTLRTGNGDVQLRRGSPGVIAPDIYADALSSSVDPKPNPNPNPDFDPDPNPYPLRSWRGPGSGDLVGDEKVGSRDDPTGEKVPVGLPANLLSRFSDSQIRSAPDRAAIVRLRDIARVHQKQHAADLVKERALWALSLVNGGRIIQPLAAALSDQDWRVRAYAAWALSAAGERSGVPALIAAVRDPHWRVRMHAVYGLELGGTNTVSTLIQALGDPHWQVRIGAVDALTTIDDPRAIAPLQALQRDSHPLVREEVASALGKLER